MLKPSFMRYVHHRETDAMELSRGQGLGKEVISEILGSRYERNNDLLVFHKLAKIEVAPFNMFRTFMMLGTVGLITCGLIIRAELHSSLAW